MARKRYVVTAAAGIRPGGLFYPKGASVWFTDEEIARYAYGDLLADPDAPEPVNMAALIAGGIADGDQLTLRRNGIEGVVAIETLQDLAQFLAPLIAAPVPPSVEVGTLDLSQSLGTGTNPLH